MQYDVESLKQIPIQDVVIALSGTYPKDREPSMKQYNMHCCNGAFHKEGDKKPSLTIWKEKNICKCHVCGIGGDAVSVAKEMHQGDFKKGCEWLHDTFSIPYLNGSVNHTSQPKKFIKTSTTKIKYMRFEKSRGFTHVEVKDFIKKYHSLSKVQRLKLVYTFTYRYSLATNREQLISYYQSRMIVDNPHLDKIGFLSADDILKLVKKLTHLFPIEDLVEFGIINDASHKFPLQWKQIKNVVLIPAFDIYTDLIEGFMLRPVDNLNSWFKGKESRLSVPSILKPLPFGVGYKLLSSDCDIYITEGHIDAFSLPSELCFIATPGVQAFEQEQLSLLKGRHIKLAFDQDEAGQKAAWGYTEMSFLDQNMVILNHQEDDLKGMISILKSQNIEVNIRRVDGFRDQLLKAGIASVEVLVWEKSLGKDINDLLVNNNLSKVLDMSKIKRSS